MVHLRYLFKDYDSDGYRAAVESYRRSGISSVIWMITNMCNLKCKFCYLKAGSMLTNELSTEEALQLIDELIELGKPLLFISGGEPLLRPDVSQLLSYAAENGLKIILSTNGTLVTSQIVDLIARLGIHYVALPFYGLKTLHEHYTGVHGSFDAVLKAISRLKERGLNICIKMIALKPLMDAFSKILEFVAKLKVDLVYICDLMPCGRGVNLRDEMLSLDDWRNLLDIIIQECIIGSRYSFEIDIGAHPSTAIYVFEKLKSLGYNVSSVLNKMAKRKLCPVGRGFIAISPAGDILPCNFLPTYSIGNIRTCGLKDIVKSHNIKSLGDTSKLTGRCFTCTYRDLCGGCRAKAFLYNGDLYSSDPTCLIQ